MKLNESPKIGIALLFSRHVTHCFTFMFEHLVDTYPTVNDKKSRKQ